MWTVQPGHEGQRRPRRQRTQRKAQPRPVLSLELLEDRTLPSIALNPDSWTNIGPAPIANLFSGRVMAIAPDPTDANVIYLGSSSGGVWKSTDAGANWTPLTDNQPTLFTGSLTIDPSNHLTVYAGTGDWSTAPGMGVLKSTNGGSTWSLLAQSTFTGQSISDLAIDPTNTSVLYAAASNGVWKSTNGAASWTRVLSPGGGFFNVVMDSTNSQTLYASSSQTGGVWKTTNGGTNWTQTSAPHGGSAGPTFLAVSRTNPRLLFATYWNDGTNHSDAYRSLDAGSTWTSMHLQAYGGMSNVIISPTDANLGYMGSTSPFLQTTDGGNSWHNIGSPHPDHHGIAFDANGSLLEGNDGGVFRLIDPNPLRGQWASLNSSSLSITQFVGIDLNAWDRNLAFAGSQDNSTEKYSGSLGWRTQVLGGDGGYSRIDPANPNTIYGETQGYNLQRSDDNGLTFHSKLNGINTSDPANFYIFYTLDPANPSRLLYGTNRVYESTNRGDNWHPISTPNSAGWTSSSTIQALTIDPNDPNTIFAVAGGTIFVTHDDGASWARVVIPGYSDTFQQVLVDPTNSSSVYVVRNASGGSHVFHSSNGGSTWNNISGNLPADAAHAVALDPRSGTLFVGTESGVWASVDGGGSWSRYKTGLPNVKTNGLVIDPALNVLAVDTYGRGLWEIALSANPDLAAGWADADIGSPGQPGDAYFDGSTWTMSGGGADIWGTADQFHFASTGFSGDVSVTAQVNGLVNTDPNAKAGVMIRDGTAANTAYAYVFVTPSGSVRFEYRMTAGAASAIAGQVGGTAPVQLRLTRAGNTFTAFTSTDGSTWTPVGSPQTIVMSAPRGGLAVTAHNNNLIGGATFSNVSLVHTWAAVSVTAGSDGLTRVLWSSLDGRADFWNVDSSFNVTSAASYGPFPGWTAVKEVAGADGLMRVLWTNTDGEGSLWLLDGNNNNLGSGVFGPFDGWTASDLTVGADNQTRLLWVVADGSVAVWTIDTNFNVTAQAAYGPYAGWTARTLAVGADDLTRLLWTSPDGTADLWLLDANGNQVSSTMYAAGAGYTATTLAVGPDNQTHLLWTGADGSVSLWLLDAGLGFVSSTGYGPFAGFTAVAVAVGSDNQARLLWDNTDGSVGLWLLDANDNYLSSGGFGPH
jgi:hypothetical protein